MCVSAAACETAVKLNVFLRLCWSSCMWQVRIFIKFDRAEASTRALVDLQGRFFGGRQVRLLLSSYQQTRPLREACAVCVLLFSIVCCGTLLLVVFVGTRPSRFLPGRLQSFEGL